MTRKKQQRTGRQPKSRKEQFRRQQRRSWTRFLAKLALFVVPVFALTLWLIFTLLGVGQVLPVLTLDYGGQSDPRFSKPVWERIDFTLRGDDIDLNRDKLAPGGPGRDCLVVFCDILGDVRQFEQQSRAAVFVPDNQQQHLTQAYQGLIDSAGEETSRWVTAEQFLKRILDGIGQRVDDPQGLKVVFVLDVEHPDLPGRLPPQANPFVGQLRSEWQQMADQLNESFQVFVWLSHGEHQKSYLDSDPRQVESFFKRRFELAVTGDVLQMEGRQSSNEVTYGELKTYMKQWVESDANVHKVSQSPVFLEPQGLDGSSDFPMLRFQSSSIAAKLGSIFDYPTRATDETLRDLEQRWVDFETTAKRDHWSLENPLAMQRATLLLLQMERLWFCGRSDQVLFRTLDSQLKAILAARKTIEPFQHTLRDAQAAAQVDQVPTFDMSLARKVPETGEGDQLKEARQTNLARQEQRSKWEGDHGGWSGALGVWQALLPGNSISQQQISEALDVLKPAQTTVSFTENAAQIEDLSRVDWNEIAYLKRMRDELTWPDSGGALTRMQTMAHQSIVIRDLSNQLAARMTPALVPKFSEDFLKLERRRRTAEDRLFATDLNSLEGELSQLQQDYQDLGRKHENLLNQFAGVQHLLIRAPHDLRYALESVSSLAYGAGESNQGLATVDKFERWLNQSPSGYLNAWAEVSQQMVGAMVNQQSNSLVDAFRTAMESVPDAAAGSQDDNEATKMMATGAIADAQRLKQILQSKQESGLGVAEGNLLARRLLLWSDLNVLDIDTRKDLHAGLVSQQVQRSGQGSEATEGDDGVRAFLFDSSEIGRSLDRIYDSNLLAGLTETTEPLNYNTGQAVDGDENYFVQVAYAAHRRPVLRDENQNDATALNVAVAINDFRCRKSTLDFQRTAGDLWATPAASNGQPFVVAALTNHQNIVDNRVKSLRAATETISDAVRDIWDQEPRKTWPSTVKSAKQFSNDFKQFTWKQDQQRAFNQSLAKDSRDRLSQMVFAIYPQKRFGSIFPTQLDPDDGALAQKSFNSNSLNIFFRGHLQEINISPRRADPKEIPYDIGLDVMGLNGARLIVKRASQGPITGHVTLVIDCSGSMTSKNRWGRAKEDILAFLDDMALRGDIKVSLVAFGADERFEFDQQNLKVRQTNEGKGLSSWKPIADADVWLYSANGEPVTEQTLIGLKEAVGELNPYGETPILAGVKSALDIAQGESQNLIVLLTDGFEYGNRNKKATEKFAPFDRELRDQISRRLGDRNELVVFSYLPDSDDRTLAEEFPNIVKGGLGTDQIRDRIQSIEKLADSDKVRHPRPGERGALKHFFEELLPQPFVIARDENGALFDPQPIQYQQGDRDRPIMTKQLGTQELPTGKWSVGVNFSDPKIAANGFAKDTAFWDSNLSLLGNEKLEFIYEPFRPSFDLSSGAVTDPQKIDLGGIAVEIGQRAKQVKRAPQFEMVSADPKSLTPVPELAVVEFRDADDPQHKLLLQDFNMLPQVSSNVHQIAFPEFPDDSRRVEFPRKSVDMRLRLVRKIPIQLWSKIRFTQENEAQLSTPQQNVQLRPDAFTSVKELLPKNRYYDGYSIEIKRDGSRTSTAEYTVRIQSESQPLDRWLVQIVGPDNRIDRRVNQQTTRRYIYRDNFDGKRELIRIDHVFTVEKEALKSNTVFFGFAHIDELESATEVDYPRYFVE